MKAIASKHGGVQLTEIPKPEVKDNYVLIKTSYSAISPGTELSLINKSADQPIYLGYSASGIVEEAGNGVTHVKKGQKVACYGAPYVRRAEYLLVPKNLVAFVPEHVDLKEAAFAGLGAIGIHALRQADLHFGEHVVVVGLGILGQIIAQVAEAAAYRVIGYDLLQKRCDKLVETGVPGIVNSKEKLEEKIQAQTDGDGVDSVLLCAGGQTSGLIDQSLNLIRDRGEIMIVGDLKMDFSRELMFKKEARVSISRAGGPGRYDAAYERDSIDYPLGYVRWTEGRNIAEYIRLLSERRLDIPPLFSNIISLNDAPNAYELFTSDPENTLGVLVDFT